MNCDRCGSKRTRYTDKVTGEHLCRRCAMSNRDAPPPKKPLQAALDRGSVRGVVRKG